MITITPAAFADHSEVTIEPVAGSGSPGCENQDGCYTPSTVTVDVGGKVIFSNTDSSDTSNSHTFTAGSAAVGLTNEFDTGLLQQGDSSEWTPVEEGEVPYFCMVHPWMEGIIIVQEAEAEEEMAEPVEEVMEEAVEEVMEEAVEEEVMEETVEEEVMEETVTVLGV